MRLRFRCHLLLLLLLLVGMPLVPLAAATGTATTLLLSRAYDGGAALTGGDSSSPSASDDGRYVAFVSNAINFGSVGLQDQIWVRDRLTGAMMLGSSSASGTPSNGYNSNPTLSGNGRYLAWSTYATNLTPLSDGSSQVYLKDLITGSTELVSLTPGGVPGNALSGYNLAISQTGRYVAFSSYATDLGPADTNGQADVYLRDRQLGTCVRISRGLNGAETNADSGIFGLAVNADGSVVAFNSAASNLVAGDTNETFDNFAWDRGTGAIERISLTLDGGEPNGETRSVDLSADGRYVVFQGFAENMIPGQEWSPFAIYLRDRTLDTTELVSVTAGGTAPAYGNYSAPGISPDGRYVIFGTDGWELVAGDTNGSNDYFVRDRQLGTTRRVSLAPGGTQSDGDDQAFYRPDVSTGGQMAIFASLAADLVPGDTARSDIFAWENGAGVTRVSVSPSGEGAVASANSGDAAVSANGRYVAFVSDAFNLVPGDTNGVEDVFLADLGTGSVERVNVSGAGVEGNARGLTYYSRPGTPGVSGDGRYVSFWSTSDNLVPNDTNRGPDVFVRDRQLGTTQRVSVSSDGSQSYVDYNFRQAPLSEDGRYVAFASQASDLVPGDFNGGVDAFVRDRLLETTERVNVAVDGSDANSALYYESSVAISGSGRQVAFVTGASNLVPGDTNGTLDVFVRDLDAGTTERASIGSSGQQGDGPSLSPSLSRSGRYVGFASFASNFSAGEAGDVYVRDRLAGTTLRASGSTANTQAVFNGIPPVVSTDGHLVLFVSYYSDLVAEDTNNGPDAFLRDRTLLATERVSVSSEGAQSNGQAIRSLAMSAEGRVSVFASDAANLTGDTVTGHLNVFVRDRAVGRPFAPVRLTASGGTGQVLLNWADQSNNETGFRIERDSGSGFVTLLTLPAGATSHLDTGLASPASYRYRVAAFNAVGECGTSNEAAAATQAEAPDAPSDLYVGAPTASSLWLQWNDNSNNEQGFRIERKRTGEAFEEIATVGAGTTELVDRELLPNTLYRYRVRAYIGAEFSAYSNEASSTTLAPVPAAPSGLAAEALSGPAVRLTWTDNSSTELGFYIDRQVGAATPQRAATTGADVNLYLDKAVQPNTEYHYFVRAFNAGGVSGATEVTVTTLPQPPAAPSNLIAYVRSAHSIQLDWWDNSFGTAGFKIERYANGTLAVVGTVAAGTTDWRDESPFSGENFYTVRAINAGGESDPSGGVLATIVSGGRLKVSPARLSFGTVKRGKTKRLSLKLKNLGSAPLSGEIGLGSAPYRVSAGGGFFTLAPKAQRTVEVEFAPTAAGQSTRSLAITSTDSTLPERAVELTGKGK